MRTFVSVMMFAFANIWTAIATNEESQVQRGTAGLMLHHQSFSNTNGLSKRHARGTWYNGKDLKNAACYGHDGLPTWDATVHDMIGAMAMKDHEECNKCLKITNNNFPELSVTVMIVDKCAGCTRENWIDLTPYAFQKLSNKGDLNIGVLDISWETVSCNKVHGHLPPGSDKKKKEHGKKSDKKKHDKNKHDDDDERT
ncbi:RlpA-like double-psi beta-barrel-protein domain-containing protein-containing protein [Phascolomyces articulosus]|uniref:RlpA-like double-psi beta-barrel-protein domain-containing protein-containing protein n=1 Tax=Phascolomyces articulosus TaxID=60185 RepID=A0AAD5K5F8_9FUNG|nr:RlpA-like double-psi beta-barrel-protein domain-containing protein-containing protein [Phascolomyces articulosus]